MIYRCPWPGCSQVRTQGLDRLLYHYLCHLGERVCRCPNAAAGCSFRCSDVNVLRHHLAKEHKWTKALGRWEVYQCVDRAQIEDKHALMMLR